MQLQALTLRFQLQETDFAKKGVKPRKPVYGKANCPLFSSTMSHPLECYVIVQPRKM